MAFHSELLTEAGLPDDPAGFAELVGGEGARRSAQKRAEQGRPVQLRTQAHNPANRRPGLLTYVALSVVVAVSVFPLSYSMLLGSSSRPPARVRCDGGRREGLNRTGASGWLTRRVKRTLPAVSCATAVLAALSRSTVPGPAGNRARSTVSPGQSPRPAPQPGRG